MLVAGTIFMVFAAHFSSIWISTNKQIKYIMDRARVDRETHTARVLLMSDLAVAESIQNVISDKGFDIVAGGNTITYSMNGTALERTDSVSTMTVAKYVSSSTSTLKVDGSLLAKYTFSKSSACVYLNVFWNHVQ